MLYASMRNSLLSELLVSISVPRNVPDGATLAHILNQLARHEVEEGGPYAVVSGGTIFGSLPELDASAWIP